MQFFMMAPVKNNNSMGATGMEYVHFLLGLVMVLALALLANRRNWKQINRHPLRYIGQLLVVELALAWFMLNPKWVWRWWVVFCRRLFHPS